MQTKRLVSTKHRFNLVGGAVIGKLWCGGEGCYDCIKIKRREKKKDLIAEAEEHLKNGTLDDGMGFEYLKGALLIIDHEISISFDRKEYIHHSYKKHYIGDLTHAKKLFLNRKLKYDWR